MNHAQVSPLLKQNLNTVQNPAYAVEKAMSSIRKSNASITPVELVEIKNNSVVHSHYITRARLKKLKRGCRCKCKPGYATMTRRELENRRNRKANREKKKQELAKKRRDEREKKKQAEERRKERQEAEKEKRLAEEKEREKMIRKVIIATQPLMIIVFALIDFGRLLQKAFKKPSKTCSKPY